MIIFYLCYHDISSALSCIFISLISLIFSHSFYIISQNLSFKIRFLFRKQRWWRPAELYVNEKQLKDILKNGFWTGLSLVAPPSIHLSNEGGGTPLTCPPLQHRAACSFINSALRSVSRPVAISRKCVVSSCVCKDWARRRTRSGRKMCVGVSGSVRSDHCFRNTDVRQQLPNIKSCDYSVVWESVGHVYYRNRNSFHRPALTSVFSPCSHP